MEREFGGRGKPFKGSTAKLPKKKSQNLAQKNHNFGKERLSNNFEAVELADSSVLSRPQGSEVFIDNGAEGAAVIRGSRWITFNLDSKSEKGLSELQAKLHSELLRVRSLIKRVEQYSGTKLPVDNGVDGRRLKRVHSEVGSVDGPDSRPREMPSMSEGKNRGGLIDKFGRRTTTPMVAQFQKNSDVTLSEGKAPLSNQSKKPKANGKRNEEDFSSIFGMQNSSSKVFKSCSSLLAKLMKTKNGWVFNTPVDAKGLGLDDYFTIIKHPMDLGTVKSRLSTKSYRTPEEFAEDVRLVFHNAMTYNMEGHEINTMAKQFLQMFEGRWAGIEADYLRELNTAINLEAVRPTPARTRPPVTSPPLAPPVTTPPLPPLVTTPPLPPPVTTPPLAPPVKMSSQSPLVTVPPVPPPTDISAIEDISEAVSKAGGPDAKNTSFTASGRSRLPKPKAKDLDKRDMTIEEKEKLSAGLQNLPSEKLEGVLRIIKKRNPSLYQNDDEIEVDIDTVDTETLWELDRFVIYYKKALSKMKRSALLGRIGVVVEPNLHEKSEADGEMEMAKENEADEEKMFSSSSNEGAQVARHASDSDGSSSSSSGSGSSSSESDTDSSSS